MNETPQSADEWAEYLKHNWERRGGSEFRDWFVAPHGWGDEAEWLEIGREQARAVMAGADEDWLARQELLEIGCGAGRLALPLSETVSGYTGVDISKSMLEEARRRCAESERARFFEGDGLRVPDAARDRHYGVILALAVFIHCPKSVVERMVSDSWSLLTPGGVMRFQVGADPTDDQGLASEEVVEVAVRNEQQVQQSVTPEQMSFIDEHYLGHAFGYAEFREFLAALIPDEAEVYRPEHNNMFATVRRRS